MKWGVPILIGFALTAGSYLWVAGHTELALINSAQIFADRPTGEIYGPMEVGQTFLSTYPNLYRIDVFMGTYERANQGDLFFHLRESLQAKSDLALVKVNAREIKNNEFFSFSFPPVRESRGKTFYFYIESAQSKPGDAITVYSTSEDYYPDGAEYIHGTMAKGDLLFKAFSKVGLNESIGIVLRNLTNYKPGPLGWKPFYTFLLLSYIIGTVVFLTCAISLLGERNERRTFT